MATKTRAQAQADRPEHSLEYLRDVGQRVHDEEFEVDENSELAKVVLSPVAVKDRLDAAAIAFAVNNKTSMLGVQPEAVLGAMLIALIAARESGNVVPFVKDMILGLNMGPTVARSHVQEYRALSEGSLFREFEIKDRTLEPGDNRKGDWVTSCSMNATAVRWAGLILFTMTNEGSFLRKVADKTGTILSPPKPDAPPPPGVVAPVTRTSLLIEASEKLSDAFKVALRAATPEFTKTMLALDAIYGDAGPSLTEAIRVAGTLVDYEI